MHMYAALPAEYTQSFYNLVDHIVTSWLVPAIIRKINRTKLPRNVLYKQETLHHIRL